VLTAGIIGAASGVFSNILYHPEVPEEPVYTVEPPAETAAAGGEAAGGEAAAGGGEAAGGEAQPIGVLLAAAKPEDGEKAAKKCAACHSFEKGGPNKVGPDLWGVVNRPIASHEGFSYSEALAGKKDQVWDYDHLNAFLKSPKEYAPGTKMSFAGLSKDSERAAVIAYLRTLADEPAPLPGS
jgi:cytochrome c